MAAKSTDWRPGPTVCRCCLSEGCYKDISTEYFWMGKREVYAEMLMDAFNLTISYSQSGGPNSNSRLICEPCISRLRDASDFKRQVQECEKTFTQYLDPGNSSINDYEVEVPLDQLDSQVKVEQVKVERQGSDDDDFDDRADFDDDDDDLDNQPLTKLASKVPKKESVDLLDLLDNAKGAVKRKSSTKTKASPAKKSKTTKKEVKPTSSKTVKLEKKKKEPDSYNMARRNAATILQYSTAYPFRLQGKNMLCVYCCEPFEDPALYRQHMNDNHENFTVRTAFAHLQRRKNDLKVDLTELKCRLCLAPYDNIDTLARHIYESHDCKKLNFDYEFALQPYKMDKGNWECYICKVKLPSLTTLGRHTTAHYQKFTCDTCGRSYHTTEALKYHIRCSHSGKHTCRKCWQVFPTAEKRRDHIQISKSCWTFCCTHCGERFKSWEHKQRHLVEVHGRPKRMFECTYCGEVFQSRTFFRSHYKINHSDENFVCSCCGLKFADKTALADHTLGHTGEKMFQCSVCLKAFSRDKSLKQHMWIHSESKRFVCAICDKQFAQKVSLKCHMKSHHPDVDVKF